MKKSKICFLMSVVLFSMFLSPAVVSVSNCQLAIAQSHDINKLITALESGNLKEKINATQELAKLGSEAKPAIPALLKAVKSNDISLSLSAEKALAGMGKDAAVAIVKLDNQEIKENPGLSLILDEIGESAVPVIVSEIKETESTEKYIFLLTTLGFMKEKAASALPVLEEMERNAENIANKTMLQLTIAQIKYGEKGLESFMQKTEKEGALLAKEREGLARDAENLAEEILKPQLTIDSPELDSLMKVLGDDIDRSVYLLSQMLEKDDLNMRALAIAAMCKMGTENNVNKAKVLPYIRKSLNDENSFIRTLAAAMLIKLGEKGEAVPILTDAVIQSTQDKEIMFALCAMAEGEVIVKNKEAIAAFEKLLSHTNINIAFVAAWLLVVSGNESVIDIVIPVAVEMLKSHELDKRLNGAAILWKMGQKARPAAAALKDAQRRETDDDVKLIIDMAVMAIGETEDDIETIVAELKSQDRITSLIAFDKLEKLDSSGKQKILPSLLQMLRTTADEKTKNSLIFAICRFGHDAKGAFPELIKILEESIKNNNTECQFMIAGILGEIGNADAAPVLVSLLPSEDRRVSNAAKLSLTELGPKAKVVIPKLIEMAKNESLSREALFVLRYTGQLETEEQANAIAELMDSDSNEIAEYAGFTLMDIGNKVAIPAFIERLNSKKDMVRECVAYGLSEVGQGDSRVVPALNSALEKEKNERVIREIKASLEKLATPAAKAAE